MTAQASSTLEDVCQKLKRFQFRWEVCMQQYKLKAGRSLRLAINNKRMRLRRKSIEKLCKNEKNISVLRQPSKEANSECRLHKGNDIVLLKRQCEGLSLKQFRFHPSQIQWVTRLTNYDLASVSARKRKKLTQSSSEKRDEGVLIMTAISVNNY